MTRIRKLYLPAYQPTLQGAPSELASDPHSGLAIVQRESSIFNQPAFQQAPPEAPEELLPHQQPFQLCWSSREETMPQCHIEICLNESWVPVSGKLSGD